MSVQKEEYIIYGCKFDEDFTEEFWKKDFRDEEEWEEDKDEDEPYFLTDGMSGEYTFFGFIERIADGFDESNGEIIEFDQPTKEQKQTIIKKLKKLYPKMKVPEIKMYYVPHYT